MTKELNIIEIAMLPTDNDPSQFEIPRVMHEKGWRTFKLDEVEKRRIDLINNNNPIRGNHLLFRYVSNITNIAFEDIDSLFATGEIITVIPKSALYSK